MMFVFQKTPLKIQLKFSKTFHLGGRGWSLLGRRGVKSACTLSSSADVGHVSIVRVKNFPRVKSFDFMGSTNPKCALVSVTGNRQQCKARFDRSVHSTYHALWCECRQVKVNQYLSLIQNNGLH